MVQNVTLHIQDGVMHMSNKLIITEYATPEDHTVRITRIGDKEEWVVERIGHLLSKTRLEFMYKPINIITRSNLATDLVFTSPEQAYQRWLAFYNNRNS